MITNMQDLMIEELQDIYSAETQLLKALPIMARAASSEELSEGFETHLEETQGQVNRLDQIFEILGVDAGNVTCQAMEGLIAEAQELIDMDLTPEVLDAALVTAAQKVEHYEIAGYGSLIAFGNALGLDDVVDLLEATLVEEKAADDKLTTVANTSINQRAVNAGRKVA